MYARRGGNELMLCNFWILCLGRLGHTDVIVACVCYVIHDSNDMETGGLRICEFADLSHFTYHGPDPCVCVCVCRVIVSGHSYAPPKCSAPVDHSTGTGNIACPTPSAPRNFEVTQWDGDGPGEQRM